MSKINLEFVDRTEENNEDKKHTEIYRRLGFFDL